MSKKSIQKKRQEQEAKKQAVDPKPVEIENKDRLIAVQNNNKFLPYRRKRKLNKRFIIMLAIWIVALVVALIYLSKL
jgi:hypothetical protein